MYNVVTPPRKTKGDARTTKTQKTRKDTTKMTKTEMKNALRNMNLMTVEEVKEKMGDALVVTLTFYKMDGFVRVMRATRNLKFVEAHEFVTDYEKPNGKGLPYNNTLKKLVTVYDLEKKGFRQVPANRMLSVVVG